MYTKMQTFIFKRRFPDSVHNSDKNDTIQLSCKKSEVVRSFSHRKIASVKC